MPECTISHCFHQRWWNLPALSICTYMMRVSSKLSLMSLVMGVSSKSHLLCPGSGVESVSGSEPGWGTNPWSSHLYVPPWPFQQQAAERWLLHYFCYCHCTTLGPKVCIAPCGGEWQHGPQGCCIASCGRGPGSLWHPRSCWCPYLKGTVT